MKNSKNNPKSMMKKGFLILACGLSLNISAQTQVNGLMNPAEVLYPETQIPTVKAQSMADVAFMNGYLHARDRLFQMDYLRRIASGRVAELVGAAGLPTDIQLRTIGFRRAALRSYQAASGESKVILRSYANGVNAYLHSHDLPVEYSGLELTSIPRWTPLDSLAIVKLIAFQLSNDLQELDWTVAIGTFQQVGQAAGFDGTALFMEDLYRAAPPDDRVTVPGFLESIGGQMLGSKNQAMDYKNFTQYTDKEINLAKELSNEWNATADLKNLRNDGSKDFGSNTWAIAADKTESGFPMVANDPHLDLSYPSVFYPIHLVIENEGTVSYSAAGVGFPGAPVIAQGCNMHLCWGSTVHPVDETDFYFEDIKTNLFGLPAFTVYNGVEEPIQYIFQQYYANQIGDGIMDNIEDQHVGYDAGGITYIVPRRNYGPILKVDRAKSQAISMQYTGFSATQEAQAFLDMTRATTVDEFHQALSNFDVGSQNFSVADIHGDIGYFTGAEVPIREDLQTLMAPDGAPPMFIRDGTGAHKNEWMPVANPQVNQAENHEIIPEAEMPQWKNPAQGYFANANNDPIGVSLDNNVLNQIRPAGGLYYISQGGYSTYRMGRIDRLIKAKIANDGKVSVNDMKAWQANNQLLDAELIMPHIMTAFNNAAANDAWPGIAQFLADPRITATLEKFIIWDYSTPTGVAEGYDPFENPFALSAPTENEINQSVAATIYSVWRSMIVKNTIDATIKGYDAAIGQDVLAPNLPGSKHAINGLKHLLDSFPQNHGIGASGINFFTNPQAPTPEDARDYVILASLKQALDLLASDEFTPAFRNSNNIMDYRWGKLHRITFSHALGASLSVPNGLFGLSTIDGLQGVPRSGGYQVLDASGHSVRASTLNGFMFDAGPARRMVATMTDTGPAVEQIIPGGQSGVITDGALYVNQLFFWLTNNYLPLIINPAIIDQIQIRKDEFIP